MKRISNFTITVIVLILSNIALAQESKTESDSLQYGKPIPVPEVIAYRPEITIQRALSLTEKYIYKENIDIAHYFLFQVIDTLFGSQEENRWYFWWVHENGVDGGSIRFTVSMNGNVNRLSSNFRYGKQLPLPWDTISLSFRPKITLQKALRMAEAYIDKSNINIVPFYLSQASYYLHRKEAGWYFWWCNENGADGDYVEITVSMDGEVRRLPSM